VLVEFRPGARLRGASPVDFTASVTPVLVALAEEQAGLVTPDLDRVRVACDWVQYKENFRDIVDVRPVLTLPAAACQPDQAPGPAGAPAYDREIAVDVRRSGGVPLRELTAARLLHDGADRIYLEDWGPGSQSCIWDFNARYWSALALWEQATGHGYEQALPGGQSDARNHDAARDLVTELFAVWERLAAARALPHELYVTELGVGNGSQAKVFLDEFRNLDEARGLGYYHRLHYLMCDYSQHVLDQAIQTVAGREGHAGHVSCVTLDATRPATSLGFLRGKIFLLYISNVYDNLPTDEVAQLGGQTYQVHTRAYLPAAGAAWLAASVSATQAELPGLVHKLLRLGPALLPDAAPGQVADVDAAVTFWRRAWSLLRLAERYVPLAGLDLYPLARSMSGEMLRPLLESGADIRMHVNNGALASFADSIELLHPFGNIICHDLFVTDIQAYRTGFRGPGKYDGSVVNWVNGPLLAHVGRRHGLDVRYEPFRHRSGGHIVTMTAQARD
jgi:hypothetical protein